MFSAACAVSRAAAPCCGRPPGRVRLRRVVQGLLGYRPALDLLECAGHAGEHSSNALDGAGVALAPAPAPAHAAGVSPVSGFAAWLRLASLASSRLASCRCAPAALELVLAATTAGLLHACAPPSTPWQPLHPASQRAATLAAAGWSTVAERTRHLLGALRRPLQWCMRR